MLPVYLLGLLGLGITHGLYDWLSDDDDSSGDTVNDTDEPDQFDGGDGDDAILSGDGDTVTGGAGADSVSHIGLGAAVATFTDFDASEDMFVVEWTQSDAPDPMLVLTDNADGSQTLSANGTDLAVFVQGGVRMEDIPLLEAY